MTRILIVNGNTPDVRRLHRQRGLPDMSTAYADALLMHDRTLNIDHVEPFALDASACREWLARIDEFDGFALTGSSIDFTADDAAAKPYLDFIAGPLRSGKPVIGSCWGMQTVATLFGGHSGPNPAGSEVGVARDITLTEAGRRHPVFAGIPAQFDATAIHRDSVLTLPPEAERLAGNVHSVVQAMAIETDETRYVGFQFHPELSLSMIEHLHHYQQPLSRVVSEQVVFPDELPEAIADPLLRTTCLGNWLNSIAPS